MTNPIPIRNDKIWRPAGRLDDFPEGRPTAVDLDGHPVLVLRTSEAWYAFDLLCTHRGAPLRDAYHVGGRLVCMWHGSEFDLATGRPRVKPATCSLRVWPILVEGDNVYLCTEPSVGGDVPPTL